MRVKFRRKKYQKEGVFGGKKAGYSYKLAYSVVLTDSEFKIVDQHQLQDYVLFKDDDSELTTRNLLGELKSGNKKWYHAVNEVYANEVLSINDAESRILEAVVRLNSLIEFLSGFDAQYEYSEDDIAKMLHDSIKLKDTWGFEVAADEKFDKGDEEAEVLGDNELE